MQENETQFLLQGLSLVELVSVLPVPFREQ